MRDPDPLLSQLPPGARLTSVRSGRSLDTEALLAASAAARPELDRLAPADRVVVGEADPLDAMLALFACWTRGLVAVCVNPGLAAPEQDNVVAATGARAWLGEVRGPLALNGAPAPLVADGRERPALILMTSGTTGRPKGIVHSLAGLERRCVLNVAAVGAPVLAQTLCVLPVFFGHGLIGNVLTPLRAGGHVHLWPVPAASELGQLGAYIDTHRVGFMSSVPSFWKLALRLAPRPRQALTRVHVGSAPLGLALWRRIAGWAGTDNVFNMFGMTETANWIGGGALVDAGAADGYVGHAWGGTLAVRLGDGTIASAGTGEVLVRSPSIMLGYYQRPDLDAEAFVGDWFRTGDTGRLDASGGLTLLGRIKTEINRGGIKVQAEEVDMLLERHPDIAEACAFGIADAAAGEAVAAAIVLTAGTPFEPEIIKAWCRQHARVDAVPARLYAVPAIPRNDRGKIVRADVRRLVGADQG